MGPLPTFFENSRIPQEWFPHEVWLNFLVLLKNTLSTRAPRNLALGPFPTLFERAAQAWWQSWVFLASLCILCTKHLCWEQNPNSI